MNSLVSQKGILNYTITMANCQIQFYKGKIIISLFSKNAHLHPKYFFQRLINAFAYKCNSLIKYFTFFEPVFNIADVSISCGIGLVLLLNKKFFPKEENAEVPEINPFGAS